MTAGPATDARPSASLFQGDLWEGVLRLLGRAEGLDDLRVHRLQLLAAARLRELDAPVAPELAEEAARARRGTLVARALLGRIRAVCDGPVVVFKGPEVEGAYPAPGLRPYTDVDVLVPDVEAVERRLREAGFAGVGPEMDWDSLHHVQRLLAPDLPAAVEVHRRPKWVVDAPPPPVDALLARAVPSATGIAGLLAPSPADHAVLLAVHAWSERPLGRLSDLVDVAVMHARSGRAADETARRYGVERLWRTTRRTIDAVLLEQHTTWPLRTWARHLPRVRERTVVEAHLVRLLEPFGSHPPAKAVAAAAAGLRPTLFPHGQESWQEKLRRTGHAVRSASAPLSEHERSVARDREEEDG